MVQSLFKLPRREWVLARFHSAEHRRQLDQARDSDSISLNSILYFIRYSFYDKIQYAISTTRLIGNRIIIKSQ